MIEVRNLVKHFPVKGGLFNTEIARVHAVNGVSFDIRSGEILGVVGESGCGKSTLGKVMIRLHEATEGSVSYDGHDLLKMSRSQLRPFRAKMQMIFQDPNSSLNPRMTIGSALKEVIKLHHKVKNNDPNRTVIEMLERVGMPADAAEKYPHEFSGGQKQRIGIARSLIVDPEFVIADEPVSALDVSIQAQVLNLLMDLKNDFNLTMMFISHDLKVIDHFCDRMLVMYLGYVVEEMSCLNVSSKAKHPYTVSLLGANPPNDPDSKQELTVLEGEVPSPYNLPTGCPFASRCPLVKEQCRQEMPPLVQIDRDHRVACWEVAPPSHQKPAVEVATF